jgi:hypothetical protein
MRDEYLKKEQQNIFSNNETAGILRGSRPYGRYDKKNSNFPKTITDSMQYSRQKIRLHLDDLTAAQLTSGGTSANRKDAEILHSCSTDACCKHTMQIARQL